jgi:hypothetical protein
MRTLDMSRVPAAIAEQIDGYLRLEALPIHGTQRRLQLAMGGK